MRGSRDSGVVLGAAVLAGALMLLGAVVVQAMVLRPFGEPGAVPPSTGAPGEPAEPAGRAPGGEEIPGEVIRLAAARAPFDPSRRAPSERYTLPGDRAVEALPARPAPELPPPPEFRVLGTVAGRDGGVAVMQVEGQPPRVVAMGEEILGYRVASINDGRVVMSGQGRNLSLTVPDALPTTVVAQAAGGRGGGAQGGGGRAGQQQGGRGGQGQAQSAQQQVLQRLQDAAQQMRQGGGDVQIEVQGDRAILTGPDGVRREIQIPGGAGGAGGAILFQRGRGAGGGGE